MLKKMHAATMCWSPEHCLAVCLPSSTKTAMPIRLLPMCIRTDFWLIGETSTVSGSATMDDSGSFGVVLSHRSAPFSLTQPTAVFVHLVSIEGVEQMSLWPIQSDKRSLAMCSLTSWSYIGFTTGNSQCPRSIPNSGPITQPAQAQIEP
jgi:hypothetical protein